MLVCVRGHGKLSRGNGETCTVRKGSPGIENGIGKMLGHENSGLMEFIN